MGRALFAAALSVMLGSALAPVQAQEAVEGILPLDGNFNPAGTVLELNWFDAEQPRIGSVTVKRRPYGAVGGETWQEIASGLGPVARYTDTTVVPGQAYEYQVLRYGADIIDVGYWLAGTEVPADARRGTVYLVIDETIVQDIAPRLTRLFVDLLGDGWQVARANVAREDPQSVERNLQTAAVIKNWLKVRYEAAPDQDHAVLLIGRVPYLQSGNVNPDGHDPVPHTTDLFYADVEGKWRLQRDGKMVESTLPGDFIQMQIGRIDFSPVSGGQRETEIDLMRAYLDKNHHWRMGYLGDLRKAYGTNNALLVEQAALRNIVGATAVTAGGHHDVGEDRKWLWGVDFGDWQGADYAEKYANKAAFAINFGSGKQKISLPSNAMVAHLAQPWHTVAVGWGGRPAWWLHHMALGGSVGEMHMRTVNNGRAAQPYRESMDYFPTGQYLWRNPIWVNLLGDPTLRAFPLAPARTPQALQEAEGVVISWEASPDPDTIGYHVYRALAGSMDFQQITGPEPITQTRFVDPSPLGDARYMVKAYGLKQVYAGSFYQFSQGAFASISQAPATQSVDLTVAVPQNQPVALPDVFNAPAAGNIHAFIQAPAQGALERGETGWRYIPPTGFAGQIEVPFSVSQPGQTRTGRLTFDITP